MASSEGCPVWAASLLQHFPDRRSVCRRLRRQKLGVVLMHRYSSRWPVPCGELFRYAAGEGDQKDEGPGRLIGVRPRALGAQRLWQAFGQSLYACLRGCCPVPWGGAWERCRSRPTGSTTAAVAGCWWRSALPVTTAIFTARVSVRGSADSSRCAERQRATNTPGVGRFVMPPDNATGEPIIRK
jgi:hypothetical protein